MSVKTYYTDERWSGQNKTYVHLHLEKVWWWHSAPVEQDTEWETFHQPWSQHHLAAPALGHLVPMHILPATANIIFSVWDIWWTPLPTNYLPRQEPSLRSQDIQLVEKLTAPSRIKRFIQTFKPACYWSLSWVRQIQSTPSYLTCLRFILVYYILIHSCVLRVSLPFRFFNQNFVLISDSSHAHDKHHPCHPRFYNPSY